MLFNMSSLTGLNITDICAADGHVTGRRRRSSNLHDFMLSSKSLPSFLSSHISNTIDLSDTLSLSQSVNGRGDWSLCK